MGKAQWPYMHDVDRGTRCTIFQNGKKCEVGRRSSVLLTYLQHYKLLTLMSYTHLRYVRNAAREE